MNQNQRTVLFGYGTAGEEVAWVIVCVHFVVNWRYIGHNGFNFSTFEASLALK